MSNSSARYLVTFFGIGLIRKYQGTAASFAAGLLWFAFVYFLNPNILILISIIILTSVLGYNAIKIHQLNATDKDPNEIVIDEVVGIFISLLGLVFFLSVKYFIVALILFRILDYFKPSIIYRFQIDERDSSIMVDDIIASLFTLLIMLSLGAASLV